MAGRKKPPGKKMEKKVQVQVTPDEYQKLEQLVDAENDEQSSLSKVGRGLILAAIEGRAVAAPNPPRKVMVPEIMAVPCGDPCEMEQCFADIGEGNMVELAGHLADLVTEHSYIARASGWSMKGDDLPDDISHGDRLLMTPFNEYAGHLCRGMIVLAKLTYKTGAICCTLKVFAGKDLKANNPKFKGVDFGSGDIKEATVLAICRGVVERVFA